MCGAYVLYPPTCRPAPCSEESGNWRAHADTALQNGNKDAKDKSSKDSPTLPALHQSRPSPASDNTAKFGANSSHNEALRGKDDPLSLQAIAESRRLDVGNLPYMAKNWDAVDLFGPRLRSVDSRSPVDGLVY